MCVTQKPRSLAGVTAESFSRSISTPRETLASSLSSSSSSNSNKSFLVSSSSCCFAAAAAVGGSSLERFGSLARSLKLEGGKVVRLLRASVSVCLLRLSPCVSSCLRHELRCPRVAAALRGLPGPQGVAEAAAEENRGLRGPALHLPHQASPPTMEVGLTTVSCSSSAAAAAAAAAAVDATAAAATAVIALLIASTESSHVGASPQTLPLPASMGAAGARVVPTPGGPSPAAGDVSGSHEERGGTRWSYPNRRSRGREDSVLAEPLLQQQEQYEQAGNRSDGEAAAGRGRGVSGGVADGEPKRGGAALRAECLREFDAAVQKEKRKVANFFKEELGFLEDKLRAVSAELKAFSASRRRRVSPGEGADAPDTPSAAEKNKSASADAAAVAPAGAAAAHSLGDKKTNSEDAAYLRRLERILLLLLDTLDKLEVYKRLNLLAFWKALKKRDKHIGLKTGKALKDFDGITAFFKQELRIPPKTRRLARSLYRQVAGEDSDLPLDVFPLRTTERLSMGQFHQEARVWFLGGCLAVLLLLTMTLLSLPMPPSTSFDYGGLMAVFPLFRFLLDLAPRGQASSISFFSFAALHFVATTGTVALYLADSKLRLLGNNQMYHLYPLGLLLLQAIFLLIPSRALSYKARKQVLAVFFSVLKAGTLVCLLCSGDSLFRPLLLGLPFYLRLCQCLIRFRCSEPGGGLIHLMNMSKYACGILVLITTNVPWLDLGVSVYAMCLLWVFSYALGSLFMLYWDVRVDWGLLPTPDRFVRMQGRLMYPPWLYGAIAVTNVSLSGNLVLLFISVIEILRRGAVPPLHQTRLEMLEGDPLMQTASVPACQPPSEASSPRPVNHQGEPGGLPPALSGLA
ncbi:hypothetical protein ACSSS7_003057 [Eimeria intestinalis]